MDDELIFQQLKTLSVSFRQWRNTLGITGSGYREATTGRGLGYEHQVHNVLSAWAAEEPRFSLIDVLPPLECSGWGCGSAGQNRGQVRLFYEGQLRYEIDGLARFDDLMVFWESSLSRQSAYFRALRKKIPGKREALGVLFPGEPVGCVVITRPGMRTMPYRSVPGMIGLTLAYREAL